MIHQDKVIVIDLDGTLCVKAGDSYADALPHVPCIHALRRMKAQGFWIIIQTSRNMNTFDGNLGLITAHTVPVIVEWLNRHGVPYDELHIGKPWCGRNGFYVDDRAIRPREFLRYSLEEITRLLEEEREFVVSSTMGEKTSAEKTIYRRRCASVGG